VRVVSHTIGRHDSVWKFDEDFRHAAMKICKTFATRANG
jgi:hypothetical protein